MGRTTELSAMRKQLLELKESVSLEQRERIMAEADIMTSIKDLQHSLQAERDGRAREGAQLAARCGDVAALTGGERHARQQAISELAMQLSAAVEGVQEEQSLRASEDAELSKMIEVLRRTADDSRKKLEDIEPTVTQVSRGLAQRLKEETRSRETEHTRLMRAISDESEARQEGDVRVMQAVAEFRGHLTAEGENRAQVLTDFSLRIEGCYAAVKVEAKERVAAADDLGDRLVQLRQQFAEEQKQRTTESSERLLSLQDSIVEERTARAAALTGCVNRVEKTARSITELSAALIKMRSELSDNTAVLHRAFEETAATQAHHSRLLAEDDEASAVSRLRGECLELVQANVSVLKNGIAKVVEALQQERHDRAEGIHKLQEGCREAVQREIDARETRERVLREDLTKEARLRHRQHESLELAMSEINTLFAPHRGFTVAA
eukprot:NODE_405_length_1595_cov_253.658442.p1 GENE.NODE_405_length_1595_cov_253.658442~~NODE_405_length_1595_cov_253.658442.p1  ORF type:complete len:439 (-),score=159.24 NODE_405_length_1595_cov_253.658442:261-1577(-)